jgi:hypothetical protein
MNYAFIKKALFVTVGFYTARADRGSYETLATGTTMRAARGIDYGHANQQTLD